MAYAAYQPKPAPVTRQQAFARAAKAEHVPLRLLLAVSYLESRWDANKGRPSVSAGYGPMHLTDGTLAPAREHFSGGTEDPRGDASRARRRPEARGAGAGRVPRTLQQAAKLTGASADDLRTDATANIRAGAALLARYQHQLHRPLSSNPSAWYQATARYGGTTWFADQVVNVLRTGASRTTDDGQRVTLPATSGLPPAATAVNAAQTECPPGLGCEWIPAPYQQLDPKDQTKYGNHDLARRPVSQQIRYIVIHDTEGGYDSSVKLAKDPTYLAWNYTVRSADGHIAQHLKAKDIGWHAGNWYVNSKSIGVEHEGFLAQGGTWYTEAMYRSSAELVRYLTREYGIPVDRAHILGHDNVAGGVPSDVSGMHQDPGPYWDWAHYFELLGRPLRATGGANAGLVTIRPDYGTNNVPYTGCDADDASAECPEHGGSAVLLRSAPSADAPLVKDVGVHPPEGDAPTAVGARGLVVTPKSGAASVPIYGRAYPEASAYPAKIPVQELTPMQYTFAAGQSYSAAGGVRGEYAYAKTFDVGTHAVVKGRLKYYEIQFGHRLYYVKAGDVRLERVS